MSELTAAAAVFIQMLTIAVPALIVLGLAAAGMVALYIHLTGRKLVRRIRGGDQ